MQSPRTLSDQVLISNLKSLVEKERQTNIEILHYLREVEVRGIHLARGYPDLYRFAESELRYSSGAAYRRVSAMKLLTSLPELEKELKSGELKLDSASQAQSAFRKENLRRREEKLASLTVEEKRGIATALVGQTTREVTNTLMAKLPEIARQGKEGARPVAHGRTEIKFTASPELKAKLDELKGLLAHQNFDGQMAKLIEKLADIALKKLKPTAAAHAKSPAPGKNEPLTKPSRHIPAAEARKVFNRDYEKGCAFQDPKTGRVCGNRHGLQMDHQVPFSRGGSNNSANLRLLCGQHNRFRAERMGLGWRRKETPQPFVQSPAAKGLPPTLQPPCPTTHFEKVDAKCG